MAALPNKAWLTSKEIADHLGITIDLLHHWRRKRTGPPYHRLVGRVYYQREEFSQWLQANRGP